MITIHQRNWKVSNDDDTVSNYAQNTLPWVLPDKYITDRLTIQLILSLIALFSLFLPSMNTSLSEKCNVLFSLVTNNSSMNRCSMLDFLLCPKSCVKYILLLCQICQHSNRKVPCFTNKVLEWYKHVFQNSQLCSFCRQSSIHSSANYIHFSVKLSWFHNSP